MKKRLVLIILSSLCVSISGCQNEKPQNSDLGGNDLSVSEGGDITVDNIGLEPDKAVYGQGVTLSYRGQEEQNILNEEDAVFIRTLFLDEHRYVQTEPNCLMDCFLNVDGIEIQYHTDCGNLMRMDNGMSMKLTEDEKAQVNEILGNYLHLECGFESDYANRVSVGKINNSLAHILSDEDSKIIIDIFSDKTRFDDATSDCLSDCHVSIDGKMYLYHSDCGTFNDNELGRSISLSDEDKALVNGILSKYLTLGFEENGRKNEGFVVISDPNSDKPDAHIKTFSEEDANIMFDVLSNEDGFINDLYKCTSDCVVSVNGIMYNYCSSCGTFNDKTNMRGLQLTDSEREVVNEILSRYTPYLNPESEKSSE